MERFFDILFSGLALLILVPVLLPIVLILRFTGEGEIFFLQERVGKGGGTFKLFKFATMLKDSPWIGTGTVTVKNDTRVLPFGSFLRKTKINELPQLLNIFLGHMSLVGPRPLTTQTFSAYPDTTQALLKGVLPGLSGIGSIIFRNEEEILHGSMASVDFYSETIAPYKGLLEEWFISKKGIHTYFMIILVTIWAVIFPRSTIVWRIFDDLPQPPEALSRYLNYTQ